MGESYLPHSVLHEKVLTLRKLFVHLVHRPKVKSQESYRPDKTQGLCDSWSRGWALLRTFPTGLSTRLQYSTASQTATESYEDTINHVPADKKSGRGGWERRGALAGFYGTTTTTVCIGYRVTGYKNIPATVILVRNIKSKTYFIQYKYHYNQYYRMY